MGRWHGDETSDADLNCAQEYADALAAIGEPVKDKDLVMLVVSGLREEYNDLNTTITTRQSLIAFSELHALLSSPSMLEARQAQLLELTTQLSSLGFQVSPIAPSGPQAFYGYSNIRANSHVTPDLEAIEYSEAYYGDDTLYVGNEISHNLLYVQKFCHDNDVFFEFHTSYFVVKDESIHTTLLTGPSKHGLYTITLPQLKSIIEGTFSIKSDIFSFGALILEIVTERKNSSIVHLDQAFNLIGYDWVRDIRGRVSREFEELVGVVQDIVVHSNCRDKWRWTLDVDGEFTVKELDRLVEEKILHTDSGGQETIWNKLVPKKVNIFVWRALKGILPVRVELDRRGIDLDSVLCPCLFKKLVREKLCEPNEVMYGTVINGLCKVGKTSKALELVRFMAKGSYKSRVDQYNMIIDGLCKDKMVDQALELFDKMIEKGITYNSLIHGLCNFGREG
ncbi:nucleotide-binding alpha-beta plait domain-containing protein [Tanacetum coccineum]